MKSIGGRVDGGVDFFKRGPDFGELFSKKRPGFRGGFVALNAAQTFGPWFNQPRIQMLQTNWGGRLLVF